MSATIEQLDTLLIEADCEGLTNGEEYWDMAGITLQCHETDVAPDAWCARCQGVSLGLMLEGELDQAKRQGTKLAGRLENQLELCHKCSDECRCAACRISRFTLIGYLEKESTP